MSGCVDIEGIQIADAINEITVSYVSMLGLSREYYQSFKKGYEKFFKFPDDDEELIRLSAIDSDAWCLVELMNHTREPLNSIPNWKRYWIEKTYLRLQGWLNRDQKVARALFRQDIGPW